MTAAGRKMVEARPAAIVIVSRAAWRRVSNQASTVANAGSYRTAAPARPIQAKATYSTGTVPASAHASTHPAARTDPAVIRARAPCRSSQGPGRDGRGARDQHA